MSVSDLSASLRKMSEEVSSGQTSSTENQFRRKKKKSFLSKAKKFGKSGRFGKGREIDKDTYDYFLRILEQIPSLFDTKSPEDPPEETEEDRRIFVDNVFATTEGEESSYCGNQLVSRVLEKLLPFASDQVVKRFMTSLADDLRRVATDPFASHVLQLLLTMSTFQAPSKEATEVSSALDFRRTWVLRVSKFLINNMDEFAGDPYACHLLRTAFQCLAGSRLDDSVTRSRKSREQRQNTSGNPGSIAKHERTAFLEDITVKSVIHSKTLDEEQSEFTSALVTARMKLESQENLTDLICTETSSGVIQSLVLVTSASASLRSECKKLCSFLVKKVFDGATISTQSLAALEETSETQTDESSSGDHLLDYESCCRLLETLILVSGLGKMPKVYSKIAEKVFKAKLLAFAVHPTGNYPLQKLVSNCPEKEVFEGWYSSEFDEHLEEILAEGNSGVVLSIAQACGRLNAKQAHFVVALMKSLHCYEPSQHQAKLAPLLLSLTTRENYQQEESIKVNLHGALLLQELINFSKPIKVVQSLTAMGPEALRSVLGDPRGCHVTDTFMASPTVGEKSRDALVKSLQGQLAGLACSKHGSRSVDAMWAKSSPRARELMASELSANIELLNANQFGKFVSQNLFLSTFKRSREEWRKCCEGKAKKSDLAKDFLAALDTKKPSQASADQKPSVKKRKEVKEEEEEEEDEFVIDKVGEYGLDTKPEVKQEEGEEEPPAKKSKKKKKTKSYLDDL